MNPIVVKVGKKLKAITKKLLKNGAEPRVGYVRRIERIRTDKRICAMTFDDGPMALACSPAEPTGQCETEMLLDALKKFGAHATFDIIGSTAENYPDTAGALGTPEWGGRRFDHYPDLGQDSRGGALACPELVARMLDEGHELANHGYRHIIFGKKPFVYGAREYFKSIDEVVSDLSRLHEYISANYGYEMRLSRPPHYVDRIGNTKFTSYDAYSLMNYGYMAASYDGGGWLPSDERTERDEMRERIAARLAEDPDFFCGQIIFGKDGYNMAKRTPAAYALEFQLSLLYEAGYKVVSVSELMAESPFADVGRECDILDRLCELASHRAIAYTDNTLRLERQMNNFELAMLLAPREDVTAMRIARIKSGDKYISEYDAALEYCKSHGIIEAFADGRAPIVKLPSEYFDETSDTSRYSVLKACRLDFSSQAENLRTRVTV